MLFRSQRFIVCFRQRQCGAGRAVYVGFCAGNVAEFVGNGDFCGEIENTFTMQSYPSVRRAIGRGLGSFPFGGNALSLALKRFSKG